MRMCPRSAEEIQAEAGVWRWCAGGVASWPLTPIPPPTGAGALGERDGIRQSEYLSVGGLVDQQAGFQCGETMTAQRSPSPPVRVEREMRSRLRIIRYACNRLSVTRRLRSRLRQWGGIMISPAPVVRI